MTSKHEGSLKIPSSKKYKRAKLNILKMLASNLNIFKPEYFDNFLCPTCLDIIPLNREKEITEAHIIPKSAGGKLKTYLCDKCNNHFGTNQDKWFGEYLKSLNNGIPKLISTDIKDGVFWIDNIKLNGAYKESEKGELEFFIHKNRNPPENIKLIEDKFNSKPLGYSLKISPAILNKTRLIEIGFLTAGYLMWFGSLGYSWVLQDHLNIVRDQIRNPDKVILGSQFVVYCEGIRWEKPWIGLVTLDDEILLTMGLENCLVLFPPADRPHIYSKLEKHPPRKLGADLRPIVLSPKPFFGPGVSILFENRYIVFPNAEQNLSRLITILFTKDSLEGVILRPISNKEANELSKKNEVVKLQSDFRPIIRRWDLKKREEAYKKNN